MSVCVSVSIHTHTPYILGRYIHQRRKKCITEKKKKKENSKKNKTKQNKDPRPQPGHIQEHDDYGSRL